MNFDRGPVFQSSLGSVRDNSSRADKTWNDGAVNGGKIEKMNHKRATVEIGIFNTPHIVRSDEETEGRNSPFIVTPYAGYREDLEKPYGQFIPYCKENRATIAYMENDKHRMFITGMMHWSDEEVGQTNRFNILPRDFPIDPDDVKEYYRKIYVTRWQDGMTVDGESHYEWSHHSKTFERSAPIEEPDKPGEEDFDYEDLWLKDKVEEDKTIFVPEEYSEPLKYMRVYRDKYKDEETNHLRMIVNSADLTMKMTRQEDKDEKATTFHLRDDGAVRMRRQLDSKYIDQGEKYTCAEVDADGNFTLQYRASDEDKSNYEKIHENEIMLRRQLDSKELDGGERYTYLLIDKDANATLQNRSSEEETTNYELIHEKEIVIRRQLDSKELGGGEQYTYVHFKENGDLEAKNNVGSVPSLLRLEEGKLLLQVGASTITLYPDHIDINSPRVNIN